MKIDIAKNASRNITFSVMKKIYTALLTFVMRTIMIYMLGIEYAGLNGIFTSLLNVLNLAELGAGTAIVYSMYEPIASDNSEKVCQLLNAYKRYYRRIGCAILLLGLLCMPFLHVFISGDIPEGLNIYLLFLMHLLSAAMSYGICSYRASVFSAQQRTDVDSRVYMFVSTVKFLLQAGALFWLRSYYIYLAAELGMTLLKNLIMYLEADRQYPQYVPRGELPDEERKKISGNVRDLFLSRVGGIVVNSADAIVISAVLGIQVLGIYQNYFWIISFVSNMIVIFYNSCIAGLGNRLILEGADKVYESFENMSFWVIWLCGICCTCFLGLTQPFIQLWVGEDMLLKFGIVGLFCAYFYVYQLMGLCNAYEDGAGIWQYGRFRPLLEGLLNLAMNLILVRFIGLYGILLSTIISMLFFSYPWLLYKLFRRLFCKDLKKYVRHLLQWLALAVLLNVWTWKVCGTGSAFTAGVFLKTALCAGVSAIIPALIYRKTGYFQWGWKLIWNLIKGAADWAGNLLWNIWNPICLAGRKLCGRMPSPQTISLSFDSEDAEKKIIYLTFDDGPSPYTRKLLKILDRYQVKASFFVTARGYEDILPEIAEAGHTIGSHTCSHNYKKIYADEQAFFDDLEKMCAVIKEKTGRETHLMRFPGGSSNTVSRTNPGIMTRLTALAEERGYKYFDWDVSSEDAMCSRNSWKVYKNVIRGIKETGHPMIVLQHDVKKYSVAAVEQILIWGLERGYVFLPLDETSPEAHHRCNN